MKTAIQFGANDIGRGFIGMLLARSGYHVTFADVQAPIVEAMQSRKSYQVEIVGEQATTVVVENITALLSTNNAALIPAIAQAEIITTAVGVSILPHIAASIAQGIEFAITQNRTTPLHIIACENAVRASSTLKEQVLLHLKSPLPTWVAFVDAAVDRIVPPMSDKSDILKVRVEEFSEWLVEASAFIDGIPKIIDMTAVENLMAGVQRKLFTLNTGHAITAWIGQKAGFKTIGDAIKNEAIRQKVKLAMQQSGDALIREYEFSPRAHAAYIEKILSRFANPYIQDEVERVGREPIRKLGPKERIVAPVLMAKKYNYPVDALLLGAAAAMHFHCESDKESQILANRIKEVGVKIAFQEISGLGEAETLQVESFYNSLAK